MTVVLLEEGKYVCKWQDRHTGANELFVFVHKIHHLTICIVHLPIMFVPLHCI